MERSEILTEEWLLRCWNERDQRDFDPFHPDLIRFYRAKPLHNLHLFFCGFHHDNDLVHLQTLTEEHGWIFDRLTLIDDRDSIFQVDLSLMI